MSRILTVQQAIDIIQAAFQPLHCIVHSEDAGNIVSFTVSDHDPMELTGLQFADSARLEAILIDARRQLMDRAVRLVS